ncbi:hypothetical protein MRQ36_09140 [Micromonospora sp. R77]|uniref:hypothetical protein n=1 Tax=Micromonospora sp. R77 TaxID=2925836 RepID=UPI001F6213C6|nr:hypothetical protein [Micromonospora sp. R77]MCI4062727.1 hypothetical protein [Micromonospora sp. R77]
MRADDPTGRTPDDGASTRRTDDRATGADGATSDATDRSTTEGGDAATGGKSRLRRGLFRRNRAKGGEENVADRAGREPEAVPAHDEEYVDWVTGLARPAQDTEPAEGRTLRTGRHHRD